MSHTESIDRSSVIKPILIGALLLNIVLGVLLCVSIFVFHNWHVVGRLYVISFAIIYSAFCIYLFYQNRVRIASVGVILYFFVGATLIAINWGLNVPFSILLYSFVILLSSIMLGPKYVIPTTGIIVIALFINQFLVRLGVINIDPSHLGQPSDFIDVAIYSAIFGVFSILGWASGSKLENLINDLTKARLKLKKQNEIIKNELEEEKRQLQLSQIEELVTLQRFADLGQNTSIILHQLANQLSVIALDDEGTSRADKIQDLDITMKEVEQLINDANNKLKPHAAELFKITDLLSNHIEKFTYHSRKNRIKIHYANYIKDRDIEIFGDPYRLEQIITILINNAFEAYSNSKNINKRMIEITSENDDENVYVRVKDYGKGISDQHKSELFNNIQSSKVHGHGIGLYVSGHILKTHFKGSMELEHSQKPTVFKITIPIKSF